MNIDTKASTIDGELITNKIKVNKLMERNVIKNNQSSGKIHLPKNLIGKKVYVVWEE